MLWPIPEEIAKKTEGYDRFVNLMVELL
jgi:hypothetical protein